MAASNGGTTLLELLYLKKIVFVYPQNQLELNFSRYLKKKGYNIFINYFKIDKEKILKIKHKIQVNRQIDKFGMLNSKSVTKLWDSHKSNKVNNGKQIWNIVTLQAWLEKNA